MTDPHRLKTAGITVNLRIEGSGPPLLFLGGSSFDLSLRVPVFDSDLPQHFTVAAADPRGLGRSDAPAGVWTMQDYARDALHVLDALGWARADILGESFGAMTALHLAALAPERVNRLALCAGAAGGEGGSSYPIQQLHKIPEARARARRALELMDNRFGHPETNEAQATEDLISARVAAEGVFFASHANAAGHPRLLAARAGHDAWDLLPDITAPTLVFAGRHDRQSPPDRSEALARALPNATLHLIDGGHSLCFATPEPVAMILKTWT